MMVLKIQFTPDEINDFFRRNGYTVEDKKFGRWMPVYHNKSEYVEYYEAAVVIDGRHVKAATLFEKVAEYRIKRMIAPTNIDVRRIIHRTFNNTLKNKN